MDEATLHPQLYDVLATSPNGNIVDVDQLIEAINLKGYVSKPRTTPRW